MIIFIVNVIEMIVMYVILTGFKSILTVSKFNQGKYGSIFRNSSKVYFKILVIYRIKQLFKPHPNYHILEIKMGTYNVVFYY